MSRLPEDRSLPLHPVRATLGEVFAASHALVDHIDLAGADDLPLGLRAPKP